MGPRRSQKRECVQRSMFPKNTNRLWFDRLTMSGLGRRMPTL